MRCTRRLIHCQVRLGEVAFACFGQLNRTRTFQRFAEGSTSGLDRACVLLPLYSSPRNRCQERIPAAWRHDIIYLFCTVLPAPSHYLSFSESRRESEEQNVFFFFFRGTVAESPESPSSEKNNRLSDTGRRWQLWSRRWSSMRNSWLLIPLKWTIWSFFFYFNS